MSQSAYQDKVVRQFTIMTVVWGIVGMLVGAVIAAQLAWPALNFDIPWLTYSRLRPLHTSAVIFAFGGCALFATSYWVVQRTCHATLFAPKLASFTFWGWQLVVVAVAITYPLGITHVDPLEHDLYFQRFLNPERLTPPDIDLDIERYKTTW